MSRDLPFQVDIERFNMMRPQADLSRPDGAKITNVFHWGPHNGNEPCVAGDHCNGRATCRSLHPPPFLPVPVRRVRVLGTVARVPSASTQELVLYDGAENVVVHVSPEAAATCVCAPAVDDTVDVLGRVVGTRSNDGLYFTRSIEATDIWPAAHPGALARRKEEVEELERTCYSDAAWCARRPPQGEGDPHEEVRRMFSLGSADSEHGSGSGGGSRARGPGGGGGGAGVGLKGAIHAEVKRCEDKGGATLQQLQATCRVLLPNMKPAGFQRVLENLQSEGLVYQSADGLYLAL